jgi:hypothetical protein
MNQGGGEAEEVPGWLRSAYNRSEFVRPGAWYGTGAGRAHGGEDLRITIREVGSDSEEGDHVITGRGRGSVSVA